MRFNILSTLLTTLILFGCSHKGVRHPASEGAMMEEDEGMVWVKLTPDTVTLLPKSEGGREESYTTVLGMTHEVDAELKAARSHTKVCYGKVSFQSTLLGPKRGMNTTYTEFLKVWKLRNCNIVKEK